MFYKKIKLTSEERSRIEQSVKALEKESSGEVVLYLAKSSDNYSDACWYFASLFGFASSVSFAVLSYLWLLPSGISIIYLCSIITAGILLGYFVPFLFPPLRVMLMNKNNVQQRVETKAHDIFLKHQVFNTVDRTGVLLYISSLERKVVVIGDKGINEKVNQSDWEEVMTDIVKGIKRKEAANGIIEAVEKCKSLLLEHGFIVSSHDKDELPNHIVVEE